MKNPGNQMTVGGLHDLDRSHRKTRRRGKPGHWWVNRRNTEYIARENRARREESARKTRKKAAVSGPKIPKRSLVGRIQGLFRRKV